jgi:hypothetical protein
MSSVCVFKNLPHGDSQVLVSILNNFNNCL